MRKKTVFLDRDGTINVEKNYLYRTEDFEFIDGAPEAIAMLKQHGYQVIVITNQAGVARGYYTEKDVKELEIFINTQLAGWNTQIDAFYFCPHHPTGGIGKYKIQCRCRKPGTALLEAACRDYPIDLKRSWMVGDNSSDIEAGRKFGVHTVMVKTGYGMKCIEEGYNAFDFKADNLYDAANIIIRSEIF